MRTASVNEMKSEHLSDSDGPAKTYRCLWKTQLLCFEIGYQTPGLCMGNCGEVLALSL